MKRGAVLVPLLAVVGVACASPTGPHGRHLCPVQLSEGDSGDPVHLAPHQELRISLPANPSTGYAWSYVCTPGGILSSRGEPEFVPDPSAGGLVGAGGEATFRFRAEACGRATLRFEYRRPWDESEPPVRAVTYLVIVG